MPNCAVYGCNNYSQKTKGTVIKYYKFPSNVDLQNKWVNACKRLDKINLTNARICSEHFTQDSVYTPLKHTLLNYKPTSFRNLKPDAIPTINLPTSIKVYKSDQNRNERIKKKRKSLTS